MGKMRMRVSECVCVCVCVCMCVCVCVCVCHTCMEQSSEKRQSITTASRLPLGIWIVTVS